MKYDLVVRDMDRFAMNLGPVLLQLLTLGHSNESDMYELEEYIPCLIAFMEHVRDEFSCNISEGNPMWWKAVSKGADQFLVTVKNAYR